MITPPGSRRTRGPDKTLGVAGNRILWRRIYLARMCGAFRVVLFPVARAAPAQEAPLTERHSSAVASRTRIDELPPLAFHGTDSSRVTCATDCYAHHCTGTTTAPTPRPPPGTPHTRHAHDGDEDG